MIELNYNILIEEIKKAIIDFEEVRQALVTDSHPDTALNIIFEEISKDLGHFLHNRGCESLAQARN